MKDGANKFLQDNGFQVIDVVMLVFHGGWGQVDDFDDSSGRRRQDPVKHIEVDDVQLLLKNTPAE